MSLQILKQQIEALRDTNKELAMELSAVVDLVNRWPDNYTVNFHSIEDWVEEQKTEATWITIEASYTQNIFAPTRVSIPAYQVPLIAESIKVDTEVRSVAYEFSAPKRWAEIDDDEDFPIYWMVGSFGSILKFNGEGIRFDHFLIERKAQFGIVIPDYHEWNDLERFEDQHDRFIQLLWERIEWKYLDEIMDHLYGNEEKYPEDFVKECLDYFMYRKQLG